MSVGPLESSSCTQPRITNGKTQGMCDMLAGSNACSTHIHPQVGLRFFLRPPARPAVTDTLCPPSAGVTVGFTCSPWRTRGPGWSGGRGFPHTPPKHDTPDIVIRVHFADRACQGPVVVSITFSSCPQSDGRLGRTCRKLETMRRGRGGGGGQKPKLQHDRPAWCLMWLDGSRGGGWRRPRRTKRPN